MKPPVPQYNILKSNEKMTLPSFLKTTNMKHLLKALSNTQRTNPSPFYLLKINKTSSIYPHPDFLSLNRTLSNAAVQAHSQKFSIWSPQHLQRLEESGIDGLQNKVLVCNPFKSEEFITQIFHSSIKAMTVSSIEEYQKIEKVKNSHFRFRNKPVNYYWAYNDDPEELENLKPLKEVIRNVVFDWSQIRSAPRIEHLTQKIMELGCSLESVVCSGTKNQMEEIKRWSLLNLQHQNRKILKQIEVRDVSDADNYILAAKSRGRGPAGIHEAAKELVDISRCSTESVMVQMEKEEWLLSKICKFPLEEQPYVYEMNIKPENTEFEVESASII